MSAAEFVLTLKKRTVAGAEKRLCDDLRWAGLHWDEGPDVGGRYRPYNQVQAVSVRGRSALIRCSAVKSK